MNDLACALNLSVIAFCFKLMKSKTDIKTLSVRIESSTLSKLMAIARKQKRTRTSLIRFALDQWADTELKAAK